MKLLIHLSLEVEATSRAAGIAFAGEILNSDAIPKTWKDHIGPGINDIVEVTKRSYSVIEASQVKEVKKDDRKDNKR